MKTLKLLSLALLIAGTGFAQTVTGFTINTNPVDFGAGWRGVAIVFSSNDSATTAFYAEVSYRLPDDPTMHWASVFCNKNASGAGVAFLWVGDTVESEAHGFEIKTWGRQASTTPPPHY